MGINRLIDASCFIFRQSASFAMVFSLPFFLTSLCWLDQICSHRMSREILKGSSVPIMSLVVMFLLGVAFCANTDVGQPTREMASSLNHVACVLGLGASVGLVLKKQISMQIRILVVLIQIIWIASFSVVCTMAIRNIWW